LRDLFEKICRSRRATGGLPHRLQKTKPVNNGLKIRPRDQSPHCWIFTLRRTRKQGADGRILKRCHFQFGRTGGLQKRICSLLKFAERGLCLSADETVAKASSLFCGFECCLRLIHGNLRSGKLRTRFIGKKVARVLCQKFTEELTTFLALARARFVASEIEERE